MEKFHRYRADESGVALNGRGIKLPMLRLGEYPGHSSSLGGFPPSAAISDSPAVYSSAKVFLPVPRHLR